MSFTTLIPALVVAVALLWPDIAEVELFGLGSVKRRLNDQDQRQNAMEAAQFRIENRIENSLRFQQHQVFNFSGDPTVARLIELLVEQRGAKSDDGESTAGEVADSAVAELRQRFNTRVQPLRPWLEIARRLNDPLFADAIRAGAASGAPSDDPRLMPSDRDLLKRVERPGHPLDADQVLRWAHENAVQLDAVRDTLWAGANAVPEALRVAAKFADQLWSDLERRGLVANA